MKTSLSMTEFGPELEIRVGSASNPSPGGLLAYIYGTLVSFSAWTRHFGVYLHAERWPRKGPQQLAWRYRAYLGRFSIKIEWKRG